MIVVTYLRMHGAHGATLQIYVMHLISKSRDSSLVFSCEQSGMRTT